MFENNFEPTYMHILSCNEMGASKILTQAELWWNKLVYCTLELNATQVVCPVPASCTGGKA